MQLWWSTIISSPSRTNVPATIGKPQRHHGADTRDNPTRAARAAARPRAQPQPAVSISAFPLVRVRQPVWAPGSKVTSPMLSHAGSASY
jgi:hypothetical protein